jgi:hypothetical protein
MGILVIFAVFIAWFLVLVRLIPFYDRQLLLVEYGSKTKACPSCGRACFGVRRRGAISEPWGEWRSECCNGRLQEARR